MIWIHWLILRSFIPLSSMSNNVRALLVDDATYSFVFKRSTILLASTVGTLPFSLFHPTATLQPALERENTRPSLLSAAKRMGHDGTDEQTDRQPNRNSHELLRHAESLTVCLVHTVRIGSSGETGVSVARKSWQPE